MQCPSCGARIEAPDRFCPACGARLNPGRPIRCPACQHLCTAAMTVCPRCQTPLELDNGLAAIPQDASLQERAFCLLRRSFVRFADFQGRSSRSEFFLFLAFCQFAGLALAAVWWPLASLFSAAMLIPSYAVSVRRMRDAGYYPWTPFVLSGAAAAFLTFGIAAGAVLGFSASGWRLPLALIGVSSALLLLVCGLFLFLVLQPTAEPGEEKRILSLARRDQRQDAPLPQWPFSQQPWPGQPFPGQPGPQEGSWTPQSAFPGQPFPQEPFPGQPCPQPACPPAACQSPLPGAEVQMPGQPAPAAGIASAPAGQPAVQEGQSELPAGTAPAPRQASPAPDAPPAEEPGQPAESLICRQEQDAGAEQAKAGGQDGRA